MKVFFLGQVRQRREVHVKHSRELPFGDGDDTTRTYRHNPMLTVNARKGFAPNCARTTVWTVHFDIHTYAVLIQYLSYTCPMRLFLIERRLTLTVPTASATELTTPLSTVAISLRK